MVYKVGGVIQVLVGRGGVFGGVVARAEDIGEDNTSVGGEVSGGAMV